MAVSYIFLQKIKIGTNLTPTLLVKQQQQKKKMRRKKEFSFYHSVHSFKLTYHILYVMFDWDVTPAYYFL